MTLTRCSDLSAADWLTSSDVSWGELVGFGPAGFPAYARLRFIPDPAYEGQSENEAVVAEDSPSETAQLRMVLETLSKHTSTPDECYFCLWDGWGLYSADAVPSDARIDVPDVDALTQQGIWTYMSLAAAPGIDPTSVQSVSSEPMVVVPNRAYFLFRGTVADLGAGGPTAQWPGQLSTGSANPAFVWPADRAWCIADDVDPHWAGIGASQSAIDRLVADPRIDVVRADPRIRQPEYGW